MSSHPVQIDLETSRFAFVARRFLAGFGLGQLPAPDGESLRSIYHAFTSLPYENVSKIIKSRAAEGDHRIVPALRPPEEVLEGWLTSRLGGTCFSLTHCLYSLLRLCGFPAYRVLGDMRHGENIHCAVIATAGTRRYLCDAGYLLPEPLLLAPDGRSELAGPVYRYLLQAEAGSPPNYSLYTATSAGAERWRYQIRDRAASDAEFEYHWARSFTAPMNDQLVLGRNSAEAQIYVHKANLRFTSAGGKKNRNIGSSVGVSVQELFGIEAELVERAYELTESFKRAARGYR